MVVSSCFTLQDIHDQSYELLEHTKLLENSPTTPLSLDAENPGLHAGFLFTHLQTQ